MRPTGEMVVAPVQDREAMEEFLRLPWDNYRHDPYWVPPLLAYQREFLDPEEGPSLRSARPGIFWPTIRENPRGGFPPISAGSIMKNLKYSVKGF